MPVIKGEQQARYQGTTLPGYKPPGQSLPNLSPARHPTSGGRTSYSQRTAGRGPVYRPPAPGPAGPNYVGRGLHNIVRALSHPDRPGRPFISIDQQGRRHALAQPRSLGGQLGQASGYTQLSPWLSHPLRMAARERAKAPQQKAGDAAFLHLFSPLNVSGVARRGAAKGLDTSFAAFQGDLSNERFVHGAPVPIRGGIKGFSLRARNPDAVLGSGVYTNNIPSRPNQFAQMSPSSRVNNAPWQQARFTDQAAADAFAQKQTELGREVRTVGRGRMTRPVVGYRPGAGGEMTVAEGHAAVLNNRSARRLGGDLHQGARQMLGGHHYLVEHRPSGAPSMLPLGVKPGTRLFDLSAPIEPGEAARAKQLLIQQLKLGRAAINRDWNDPADQFGGKEDVKRWASELLPESVQAFDDMERLAKLHAAGRNQPFPSGQRYRATPAKEMDYQNVIVPTGRQLHRLIDAITRGVHQPTATAYLDEVPRDQQHILDNPNSVLRQMGYHGLIDPTFNVGGETGKEVVMFDKNRLEPFHDTRQRANPYVRQPYPVTMAKQLSRVGANFVGAVKKVRSGEEPQIDLPLSDEVQLTIINLGDGKVRYFLRSAKHPDATGKELNGAQALNLAHRSLVERKGGFLDNGTVTQAFVGGKPHPHANPERAAQPVDQGFLGHLLGQAFPEVAQRGNQILNRRGYYNSGMPGHDAAHEQALAGLTNPKQPGRQPSSLEDLVSHLKKRQGREASLPEGAPLDQLRHTMHGVHVPNNEHLNFDVSHAQGSEGTPLIAFGRAPRAHEFFSHGSLVTYLSGLSPQEKEAALVDLDKQLTEKWYGERQYAHQAPHNLFPRFPNTPKSPSFGGLAPAEPGGKGRPPFSLPASMEPLQRAMQLARQHGLRGSEARTFIRTYLQERRRRDG